MVGGGVVRGERGEFVIPKGKCFRRRKRKAGDGKGPTYDSKPKAGAALGAAHRSHGRLRSESGFGPQESMPQACHGALEMDSGSARASCEQVLTARVPSRVITPTCGDARWRSRPA